MPASAPPASAPPAAAPPDTEAYRASLAPKERAALAIAETHLATSFSLERSNGFLAWAAARK